MNSKNPNLKTQGNYSLKKKMTKLEQSVFSLRRFKKIQSLLRQMEKETGKMKADLLGASGHKG